MKQFKKSIVDMFSCLTMAFIVGLCFIVLTAALSGCGGSVAIDQTGTPDDSVDSDSGQAGASGSAGSSDDDGGFAGSAGSTGGAGGSSGNSAGGSSGAAGAAGSSGSPGAGGTAGSGTAGMAGAAGSPDSDAGDAGTDALPEQDSGSDAGDADAGCEPRLVATWNTHYESTACPGDVAIQTLAFTLTAECHDMKVHQIALDLSTPDYANTDSTPFCKAPCASPDDWYFRNIMITSSTGVIIMYPIATPKQGASNQMARVEFTDDSFYMGAGESKLLILQMDVSDSFTSTLAETRYHANLLGVGVDVGNGDIPIVVQNTVDPNAYVKVKNSCEPSPLQVELLADTPESKIVVPSDAWYPFTKYTVTNSSDSEVSISHALVSDPGLSALWMVDFTAIEIRVNGAWWGQLTNGFGNPWQWQPANQPVVPPNSSITVEFFAKVTAPLPSSTSPGEGYVIPRSGDTPALQIVYLVDSNMEAAEIVPHEAPFMVLRKSKPTVTSLPLASNMLVNADIDLFKFQVTPDAAGPVALKQFSFMAEKNGPDFSVSQFRVRRGAVDMDPQSYYLVSSGYYGGGYNDLPSYVQSTELILMFTDEEYVAGSGSVYTIHGTVTGASPGSSLVTTMNRDAGYPELETVMTGQFFMPIPPLLYISEGTVNHIGQTMVWSDVSEIPHSASSDLATQSADWTNGYLVQGSFNAQVLAYN